MKYSDQSELTAMLAPLILRAATPLFSTAYLLVPVPMHRWRLTHAAWRTSLRGAFRVRDAAKAQLACRHVLLAEDVLTTGATSEACPRTLLRAGAGAVDTVTLARVVMPETLAV